MMVRDGRAGVAPRTLICGGDCGEGKDVDKETGIQGNKVPADDDVVLIKFLE
jgi:hypothetical protein